MVALLGMLIVTAFFALGFVPLALAVAEHDPRYPWYQTWPILLLALLTLPGLITALIVLVVAP